MKQVSQKANQENHLISKQLSQWYQHLLSDPVIKSRAIIIYNEEKSTLLNIIIGSLALKIYTFVMNTSVSKAFHSNHPSVNSTTLAGHSIFFSPNLPLYHLFYDEFSLPCSSKKNWLRLFFCNFKVLKLI